MKHSRDKNSAGTQWNVTKSSFSLGRPMNTSIKSEVSLMNTLLRMLQNLFWSDSRFAPSQWETLLLCNNASHWPGTSPALHQPDAKELLGFSRRWPKVNEGWGDTNKCICQVWGQSYEWLCKICRNCSTAQFRMIIKYSMKTLIDIRIWKIKIKKILLILCPLLNISIVPKLMVKEQGVQRTTTPLSP